ncbi:unannotated protein [freshwater metagenome]|uniref:Unannotated protein n=1 Tax=freshwater metagenome TaxID=449393 RepID=A0A6J7NEI2_9ZZZZ
MKFSVVPEPSERWATVMPPFSFAATFGFSATIAGSSQAVTSRWKIFAMVAGERLSSLMPDRL